MGIGGDEKTTLPKASINTNWVFLPHGVSPATFQHLHETITNGNGVISNWNVRLESDQKTTDQAAGG